MKNVSTSMRCFLKGSTDSPLVQFGSHPEDSTDSGDGGGIPVFSSLSIPSFGMRICLYYFMSPLRLIF